MFVSPNLVLPRVFPSSSRYNLMLTSNIRLTEGTLVRYPDDGRGLVVPWGKGNDIKLVRADITAGEGGFPLPPQPELEPPQRAPACSAPSEEGVS